MTGAYPIDIYSCTILNIPELTWAWHSSFYEAGTDDSEVSDAVTERVLADLRVLFPDELAEVTVEQVWMGVTQWTQDGFPWVGPLPSQPGNYIAGTSNVDKTIMHALNPAALPSIWCMTLRLCVQLGLWKGWWSASRVGTPSHRCLQATMSHTPLTGATYLPRETVPLPLVIVLLLQQATAALIMVAAATSYKLVTSCSELYLARYYNSI